MISLVLSKISLVLAEIPLLLRIPMLLGALWAAIVWWYNNYAFGKYDLAALKKIPGPEMEPVIGNMRMFAVPVTKALSVFKQLKDKYGGVARMVILNSPRVVISSAEGFEVILGQTTANEKGTDYRFLDSWLGNGLLLARGEFWHRNRKMLTPAFHFKILEEFLDMMNEQAKILTDDILAPHVDSGKTTNMAPSITNCALDIICSSAMGKHVDAQHDSESEYARAVHRIAELTKDRTFKPLRWNDKLWSLLFSKEVKDYKNCLRILHGFTNKVIGERRIEFREEKERKENQMTKEEKEEMHLLGKKKRLAFLDILLEASESGMSLTDEYIRAEVDTIMFEGHDTTANSMAFATYLLARYPKVQAKARAELNEIFGGDADRPCTPEDLSKMKYLGMVLKETLRLYPIVPCMTRITDQEIVVEGKRIPPNTDLYLHTFTLHRDEKWFPDAEKFDPERFTPEATAKRHPYAYVPFSAGSRNCIGQKFAQMEQRVVMSSILRKYELSTDMTRDEFDANLKPEMVVKPGSGVPVYLKRRTDIVE